MKYAALIYADESDIDASPVPGSAEFDTMIQEYGAFSAKYADKIVGGEALETTAQATSLRVRNGESVTTDGPFAETKEHLGGFYLFDCADLDEALAIAADIPHASTGTIEVRPVPNFEQG